MKPFLIALFAGFAFLSFGDRVDAGRFGFSPDAAPDANAAALQRALDGGHRHVHVSTPGTYRLDRTVYIDDDTVLEFAEGVVLSKTTAYANVLANRGAFFGGRNRNIVIRGANIATNGRENVPPDRSRAAGLRGLIGFYGIDNLELRDVTITGFGTRQYAVQIVDFDGLLIDGFELRGEKDGIHLNAGRNFVIRNGKLRTYDDGIAINAGEWPGGCTPLMGSITDGLIENVEDEPGGHCNFARVITGAWMEWHRGMPLQYRDIFTIGKEVYSVYPGKVSTNEVVSLTPPSHTNGVWTSPEGINFFHCQSDGCRRADIRRVTFRNIRMNCERGISCSWELGSWARLVHPELPRKDYPVIDIRLENVVKAAKGAIVSGNADADIVFENCRSEQGPLASMGWSKAYRTQCPVRRITVDGVTTVYSNGACRVVSPRVAPKGIVESAREIPVAADVDVVVVGGTAAGVSAAVAAADAGASVFLAGGFPYLGEDLAGTLELQCDKGSGATALEQRLCADTWSSAPYDYDFEQGFGYFGGWQYFNDEKDKLSTPTPPATVWDSVLFTNEASVACAFHELRQIDGIEVQVIENVDRRRPAAESVDHRGAISPDDGPGPLTGAVSAILLDGTRAGLEIVLERDPAVRPIGGEAIRDGEPEDVKSTKGASVGRTEQVVVAYRAKVDAKFRRVRVRVTPAEGAACQLLSRIRFLLADADRQVADPSPLKVKRTFDEVLAEKGVTVLTGSPVTDILRDGAGDVAGIVIANRSGRQAIRAKSVVDATRYGVVGRLGQPVPGVSGRTAFTRVIVSGERPVADGVSVEALPGGRLIDQSGATGLLWRCGFELPMADGSYPSFAKAESLARDLLWHPSTFDPADQLRLVTPPTAAPDRKGLWTVSEGRPLGARIRAGAAAGCAAAEAARLRGALRDVRVESVPPPDAADGDVRELLGGLRPYDRFRPRLGTVRSPTRVLPVLGEYDVVVVGGGTAGAPAAIGAARQGARTLLLEYLHVLGGVSSDGMITGYYAGNHVGFVNEFDACRERTGGAIKALSIAETFRRMCRDAGADVWFGSFGSGVCVKDGKVAGVVVVTPFGRGVVRARCVIDATGNSDMAAAAGARTTFIGARELALQSAGQAPHRLGRGGVNSDFGYVNDPDAWDLWLFGVRSRAGAPNPWDIQQLVDSRERRRIVPDLMVEGWDVVMGRKFPDTVNRSRSKQDSHGFFQDDYGAVAEVDGIVQRYANLPLRCYLPEGVGNLAVVGLGKGVARDVVPFTRMRADMINEGYALGLCAAEAARSKQGDFRAIDVKTVQRKLVEKGNLPSEVLTWKDDPEPTDDDLARIVSGIGEGYRGSGYVFRYPARSLPFLRREYAEAKSPGAKQAYAIILGLLGDATGAETLAALVDGKVGFSRLREGVSYCGEKYDRIGLSVALGRTKAPCALEPLVRQLRRVDPVMSPFRMLRAATLGLEELGDPQAANPLAEVLARPGVGGWAVRDVKDLPPLGGYGVGPEMDRCLRELALARALLACGDCEGLARRTLESYAKDPRGALAEHANAVLSASGVRVAHRHDHGAARWISGSTKEPEKPAPVIYRDFWLDAIPSHAAITLAVAGWHELTVNGRRVGDEVLSPVTCQPDQRISSVTRDIAGFLRKGENRIEVLLGNGWFNCFTKDVWGFSSAPWREAPMIRGSLCVDGRTLLVTDGDWRACDSPVVFNALRNGEWYDARREGLKANDRPVTVVRYAPHAAVSPEDAAPCRTFEPTPPVRSFPAGDGGTVYDFGSNRSGWCEIEVLGEAGAKIAIDYDEALTPSNTFCRNVTTYLRQAGEPRPCQHDEYVLAGRADGERWHPRFAYHGFRYAQVRTTGCVEVKAIRSVFVHSDFAEKGAFSISDPLFAKLLDATRRSYLSNFVGIPTDCPHREKNGWTGDAQLAMETGLWNFDGTDGYTHFLRMILDSQRRNGAVPCISPCTEKFGFFWGSGPAWDAILFEIPWQIFRFTGDDARAREAFAAMRRYLDFIDEKADKDGLVDYGLGDWSSPVGFVKTPVRLTDSAYVYEFNRRAAIWAERFGEQETARTCRARAEAIREAFNRTFYKGNGIYADGQPTALAAALYFPGLCADGESDRVAGELVRRIREGKHKAAFGILGAKWVPRVLSEHGYIEDAWCLFVQPEYPGWARWMERTDTLWEQWEDKTTSFNHIMFGDLSAWAFEYLAGIKVTSPGFEKVEIKPYLPKGVESFSATYASPKGEIKVFAERVNGQPIYRTCGVDGNSVCRNSCQRMIGGSR